jgi:hypothetical protein
MKWFLSNHPVGLRIIVFIIGVYSISALLSAVVSASERNELFFPFLIIGSISLVAFFGLLKNTTWGRYWAITAALILTLASIFGGFPALVVLINGVLSFAIILYIATEKQSITEQLKSRNLRADEALRRGPLKMAQDDLDQLRYDLDVEKFQFEKARHLRENGLIARNFGVIITAIISFSAIVVSYLQLTISTNNAKAQIDNEQLKNDRQFYFEIAKFLLDHQQDMTTNEKSKVVYLKNVVVSSFPPDVGIQIATSMRDTANTNDIRAVWEEGILQSKAKRAASK